MKELSKEDIKINKVDTINQFYTLKILKHCYDLNVFKVYLIENGIKIVVTLKKEANPNVVLNNLYKHTPLQSTFGIILLMLDKGVPKTLSIKEIISKYVDYQKEVIVRRTTYDLKKAEQAAHILEGYKIALDNLDAVINIIRNSKTDAIAKEQLMNNFNLSEAQTDAILELRLRRLTGLEREKIENDLKETLALIADLKAILASDERIFEIIKNEMKEIKAKYGDERRTTIDMSAIDYIEDESLIPEEDILITLTNKGYIKRVTNDTFKIQNRGGVGIKGLTTNEEDYPEQIVSMMTHDYILMFSNLGKVYRMKGYEIPEFSRQSKGLPIVNLLSLEKDERITSVVTVNAKNEENKYLLFVTKRGLTKRTDLSEFELIRNNGKKAIVLKENDELIAVRKTDGEKEVVIAASNGKAVRFKESEIRIMGRSSSGVKGIELNDAEQAVGAEIIEKEENVLVVTEKGYGKKTHIEEYRLTHRGSKGVKTLNITEKNGNLVAMKKIVNNEDLIIVTDSGMTIRISTDQISQLSRNTQGVRLINLKENQKVSTIAIIEKQNEIEENVEKEIE